MALIVILLVGCFAMVLAAAFLEWVAPDFWN